MSTITNSRPDQSRASSTTERQAGGNKYYPEMMDGSSVLDHSKTIGGYDGGHGGGHEGVQALHQKAQILLTLFKEYLAKADMSRQSGGEQGSVETEKYLDISGMVLDQLNACCVDLQQMGQSNEGIMRSMEQGRKQLKMMGFSKSSQGPGVRKNRGSSIGHDGGGKNFQEAMAWIAQQKRLIETSPWRDDQDIIEWQMTKHNKFHSSVQRSLEVERARTELELKGDQLYRHFLEQEWDSLQKMSWSRSKQLQDLSKIFKDISGEIIWVKERKEEELVFDWGDKNIDNYIPKKQDSYLRLMRDLEKKEKDLNKLSENVENFLNYNHPAADKIMAYKDTLQTQWSWLLQITKCINTHLKENAAYSQFFKEANEMHVKLQEEHENIHKRYTCDRDTPLEKLQDLLENLEREKVMIMKNKWQVQHLVNKSKSIVRLRPRNPHEKSSSPVIVKALCDFKQDQKQILKGNEAILKDNSQHSKWQVKGPGGLDMLIPSVCLLVPPPNPLSISLANKTEQLFEAIMGIWNQLFINIKSLISWRNIETMFSLLSELHTLRQKLEKTESGLTQHIHIPLGENSVHECSQRIVRLEGINQDLNTIREEYVKLREKILFQLDGMKDTDKAEFLRSELNLINQKIGSLEGFSSSYIERLKALQAPQQSLLQVEDIVKVHEARLTEKETSSLEPRQLEDYRAVLKKMKQDLDQKRDVLKKLELELGNAERWNDQISQSFHKCDVDLSRYREQVTQMSDRWRRILSQIDSRVWDLEKQQQHLQQYQQSRAQVSGWIDNTQQKQDSLLSNKFSDVKTLIEHLNQQKKLYSEIKGKKDKVDDVVRDANTCASSITDYELELASYSAGLETLLNIPIKRTMLQSPATVVREEATDIQAKYIELLTRSGDYYKFLGNLQKNMEELGQSKMGTGVLEEELRWLLAQYWSQTNQYLADSLARYQLDSKQELRSLQESLEKALKDYRAATEKLDRLTAELKALQQQLTQEQAQVREVNIRYETLYKTIEEKSKMLNDHSSEIQRLQGMTKERVEEELRALRQEFQMCYKELLQEKESLRMVEQVQGQVQNNKDELKQLWKLYELKYDTEKGKTVQELTSLRSEIEKLTALVDRNKGQLQSSEWVVTELARIRDELEKGRAQKNEDELKQLRKVVEEWKSQYERKSDTDKGKLQQELESLTSHIKTLTAKLRALEVGDKKCSHTPTCISSFEVQLQTINKTVEQGLTQKNHDIEMLATKLQSFEQVVSELARIRDELEKGRVQKSEDELKQLRKLYELKCDTEKVKTLEELTSLRSEIEKLKAKLRALEVGGNKCSHTSTYISSLKVQLQTNIKKVEQELTKNNQEIEMLTTKLQSFEQVVSELAWIRDELEKGQAQKNEDELKQLLKVFEDWKSQYDRKSDTDKGKLQQEHESLWCEIKMLTTKLRALEDGYKKCSHTSTYISSFEVQLQTINKTVEQGLTQNNHEIEMLTTKLQSFEQVVSELAWIRDELEKGRVQKNEDELKQLWKLYDTEKVKTLEELTSLRSEIEKLTAKLMALEDGNKKCYHTSTYISSLKEQLQTNIKKVEQELTQNNHEIEMLTTKLQSFEQVVSELAWIRDELEKGRVQKNEDELKQLQKVVEDWKSQYEWKSDTDKGKLQKEHESLWCEIKMLTAKLRALEVGDKKCSHTSTYISSLKVQLQTNIKKVEHELTQNNHEIEMLTAKLRVLEDHYMGRLQSTEWVVSELAWIRDELEKGQAQKNEVELEKRWKVFEDWKRRYELKSGTDKGKLQQELESLRSEIEMLTAKLSALEVGDKKCCYTSTYISSFEVQLQTNNHKIEMLTAKLRDLEDRYKGRLHISEQELSEQRELKLFQKRLEHLEERIKVHHHVITIKEITVRGIRGWVSITDLVESKLLNSSDVQRIAHGQLTIEDIERKLRKYLQGSGCIAGIFLWKENRTLPIYQAKKEGLLHPGTSLVLLEAQAASGFMIDPLNNLFLTVEEACERNLIGQELKSKLLSAENAVTGYKDPHTGDIISLFQAIEKGIIEKGHGIRLLEAQIASGGIIEPKKNHRIDVDEAFRRGYFNKEMNDILADEGDDTKGFFDPNTEENLTYLQLMKRCITDEKTGLVLLPLWDKKESRILRMREQECEWEEITILAADSSIRLVVVDQKTGKRYDIQDYLDKGWLSQSTIDQYHSGALTLTEFANQILNKSNIDLSITSTCAEDVAMVEEDNRRKIIQTTTTTTSSLSSTSWSTSSTS